MWFFLRMTFWLAVVLVLLPNGGSQTAPKSQVSASEAFSAARGAVTDFEHFCAGSRKRAWSDRGRPSRSASARKQAPKCSMSFSLSVSAPTSPNSCELRTRFAFLGPDRISTPTAQRHPGLSWPIDMARPRALLY